MTAQTDTDSIDLDFYAGASDLDYSRMAIPERNEILDELRRRDETLEMRAEETARGYNIPTWPYAR